MTKRMWQLMGWSDRYHAPIDIAGVLRVEFDRHDAPIEATAWLREDEEVDGVWGKRLSRVSLDELPAELDVWELSQMEPAVPVTSATPGPELKAVRRIEAEDSAA